MSNPKAFPCAEVSLRCSAAGVAARPRRKTWVLVAAVLGSTMAFVDESVVNVALPRIEGDLHASLAAMQWVVNAYTLCMSALLLTGGAAADRFGRRLVFVLGAGIFAIASIGCGLATTVQALLIARGVQGAGAALLVPCSLALIAAAYDQDERGAAIGIWSGASAIAAGAAPLLGGWLVDHSSWRSIFLINPLIAIPALWIAVARVPESRDPAAPGRLDWPGATLAFLGLGCLVYGLTASAELGLRHVTVLGSMLASVTLFLAFVGTEKASASPMMPLELFHSSRFSGVNLLTLLLYGALGGAFFFLPFLLIQAHGYSATAAGAVYLPFTLVLGALSRWSGGISDRIGARLPLIAGPIVTAVSLLMLSASTSYSATIISMTVLGFGMAITVAPLTTTVFDTVPTSRTGIASGINNAVAATGGLLLIALLGSVCVGIFDRSLEQHLTAAGASESVRDAVEAARNGFVIPPMPGNLPEREQRLARTIVVSSLEGTVRTAFWVTALLALAGAVSAALTIPAKDKAPG
ncbi:MAG: MFS transporter [Gammaproteobacteria bacterium]|nr:MFS transporter [Gammaproteobacteria bacterium]